MKKYGLVEYKSETRIDCGQSLTDIDKHGLCENCRKIRHDKWVARLKTGAKVAGTIGTVVGTVYLATNYADDEARSSDLDYKFIPYDGGKSLNTFFTPTSNLTTQPQKIKKTDHSRPLTSKPTTRGAMTSNLTTWWTCSHGEIF